VHRRAREWSWEPSGLGCAAVTVRVTTLKGADAGAYYVEALPNYYLDSGEPRGVWMGDGASLLGLADEVADDQFLALMAGMDPQRPDRALGRAYDDTSVRGFDVTCSAPKSVSVMFALGDHHVRQEVLAAHDAAVAALAGWIEGHAHTRYRIGGEVAVVDAEGIVAAAFRQHTSRALDPQIHTHLVIANRVKSPDGRWLALDARLIKHDQQTLSALYHASLRAEMTARLGVRWHAPERGIAEMRDVSADLLVEFSARTSDVRRRVDDKLDRFIESMGREPTPRERWRLEREAVVDSRPHKSHSIDAEVLHAGWAEQTRRFGLDPDRVVDDAVDRVDARRSLSGEAASDVLHRAMDSIVERQSSWRPTELHREVAGAVPTDLAVGAEPLVEWIEQSAGHLGASHCVDLSLPIPAGAMLRRDGRPVSESAIDRALTTRGVLDQEAGLIEWADRRLGSLEEDHDVLAVETLRLTAPQRVAASAVAGGADLVLVVGPAGTGKTTALAPAIEQLRLDGRAVFGVAPSAASAEVLAIETSVEADTVDKLLIEHNLARRPDHRFDLPAGATVIVDEAGMIPTAKLAELAALADQRSWRVVLVGDPQQFSAVGRGGMFGLTVDAFGAIELDSVHRFINAWERDASLRLRRGDVDVLDLYDSHERLRGGPSTQMERNAIHTWWRHRQAGDEVLLMAPTNETVAVLNERAQLVRIHAGEIDPDGRHARIAGGRVFVGDEIATRHNDRRLRTDRGDMVRNRATWTVDRIGSDGSLVATGRNGSIRLPASYVAEHVELAYATTGMGAQGRTVDVGILYVDRPTDVRNIYVPLTRGRSSNVAFVATTGEDTAVDLLSRCLTTDWIDQPAHTRRAELTGKLIRPPSALNGEQLRQLFGERYDLRGTEDPAERAKFKRADEAIWRDIYLRAHRLRLQQPDWAIEQLGPMEETAGMRRLWGIFAAHLEQHHVAYSDVIDHEDAYASHCRLVNDIADEMQERESVSADMSIDM
jgi:conjugative relaxase-like TrwC/TraI family protein